jgi:hypothetical protein
MSVARARGRRKKNKSAIMSVATWPWDKIAPVIAASAALIGAAVSAVAQASETISLTNRRKKNLQHIQDLTDLMDKIKKQGSLSKTVLEDVSAEIEAEIEIALDALYGNRQRRQKTLERTKIPGAAGIVTPAALRVALITMLFWVTVDFARWAMGWSTLNDVSDMVIDALSPALGAAFVYGSAVSIALGGRAAQIEEKVWQQGSFRCLIPIAVKAGLVTWGLIIAATVILDFPQAWHSQVAMLHGLKAFIAGTTPDSAVEGWRYLPNKIATAFPWMLVGATAAAVFASSLRGDVRRLGPSERMREAIVLGVAVALAAAAAQSIQAALMEKLEGIPASYGDVPLVALAAFACGASIGFKVPVAWRINLMTPLNPTMTHALRDLLAQARTALGSNAAAEDWVFEPHNEPDGITPAETVQYKTHATGVGRLLESEACRRRQDARSDKPVVIEEGCSAGSPAASITQIS